MKIAVISVNNQSEDIIRRLSESLDVDLYNKKSNEEFNLTAVTGKLMETYKALVFIAAVGIAVRAVAPFVKSKDKDPAVVVIDSAGRYAISLLSGHLGGANELTKTIAELIGAEPVITTATDSLGVTGPDLIATENGLIIDILKETKHIAALLVKGEKVGFLDEENKILLPKGYSGDFSGIFGIVFVTNKLSLGLMLDENIKQLKLIRRNIVLGIGCKKDYSPEKMRELVLKLLEENNIDKRAVKLITSVDVKKEEKSIQELARYFQADIRFFSREEIKEIQDKYEGSQFVEKSIGVKAVCQPCVELSGGSILTDKISCDGMTLCIGKI